MTGFIQSIVSDDFVWDAIASRIAGQGKLARGFLNINCPMPGCGDQKRRCGIRHDPTIVISCYNCGFRTGWGVGSTFGGKFRSFLSAVGVGDNEIASLNYRAFQYRHIIQKSPDAALYIENHAAPTFDTMALPVGARSMIALRAEDCQDPDFLDAQAYIRGRGRDIADFYDFHWSSNTLNDMNRRVIIPMMYEGRTVGYSARAIDAESKQRYHMHSPKNFLFNSKALTDPKRQIVILCEGILDAIAIDSVGLLGAHLNQDQVTWIKSYNKKVILLVDRDRRGVDLIDIALANDWHVSFCVGGINNWWDPRVKDAAQATQLYGRLWTLTSVLEEATNNKNKINFHRRKLLK